MQGTGGYLAPFQCLALGTHCTALDVSTCHTFVAATTWRVPEAAHNFSTPDPVRVERQAWVWKCQVMGYSLPLLHFLARRSCPGSPGVSVSSTRGPSIVTQAQPVRWHETGRTQLAVVSNAKRCRVFGRKHDDTGVVISRPSHLRNHAFPLIERRWVSVDQDEG